jgi:hypothetical protein
MLTYNPLLVTTATFLLFVPPSWFATPTTPNTV